MNPPLIDNLLSEALAHHRNGQLARAESIYREILEHNPDNADALHYCGIVALQKGEFTEAVELIRAAIEIQPGTASTHSNLGNALMAVGQIDAARQSYQRALEIEPDQPHVLANLGNAFSQLHEPDQAIQAYQAALHANPQLIDVHVNLAQVELAKGLKERARSSINRARQLAPDSSRVNLTAANILFSLGDKHQAETLFRAIIAAEPTAHPAHVNLGNLLRQDGRTDESLSHYARAIAISPGFAEAHYNRGLALQDIGDLTAARQCFRRAISIQPDYGNAFRALSLLGQYEHTKADTAAMLALVANADTSTEQKKHVAFALGKALEDLADYKSAYRYYTLGNALHRASIHYDIQADERLFDQIRETFTPTLLDSLRVPPESGEKRHPIFIVGLPRSGTTLIEQILASHSQVFGAGEVDLLLAAIAEVIPLTDGINYTQAMPHITPLQLSEIQKRYLQALFSLAPGILTVTDKLPMNFLHIGMISLLFPQATIVHCRRDPLDTCLSIFKHYFPASGHDYGYDVDELARYYRRYSELMDHWKDTLPGRIHEVRYESLIMDQERVTRELLAACELGFEPECLNFHETSRRISTLSAAQVRKPIYRNAMNFSRHYGAELETLTKLLANPD